MDKKAYKELAYKQLGPLLKKIRVKDTLVQTLSSFPWMRLEGQNFSNRDFNQMNLSFDTRSCLPRALFCVMVGETYFPDTQVQVAEVLDDLFRNIILHMGKDNPALWDDPTFVTELLMYEEPHFVTVIDNVQFEPLVLNYRKLPQYHPKIHTFDDTWDALAAAHTVSEALDFQEKGDMKQFKNSLQEAKELCPDLLLVDENLLSLSLMEHDMEKVSELISSLHGKRADAKFLWLAYEITRDKKYLDEFLDQYPMSVFNFIKNEVDGLL